MSDPAARRQRLALALAGGAFVLAAVSAGVVIARGGPGAHPAAPDARPGTIVIDRDVRDEDLVRLHRGDELVPIGAGIGIADPKLAAALGLEKDDVITAVQGRQVTSSSSIAYIVAANLPFAKPGTIYVELARGALVRWKVDPSAKDAWMAALRPRPSATVDPFASPHGVISPFGSPSLQPDPPPDPLLDQIERVDDTHVRVPRKVIEAIAADPAIYDRGARIVPALQNGMVVGFKLYAIRPGSVFARVGFMNGDTIVAINGIALTSADKLLETYTMLKSAIHFDIQMERRGQPISLTIDIR